MAQLVPCPQCGRHVRLSDASCPFCDVALDATRLSEQYAPRRVTAQPGVKRAAMFALGASVVAACSGDQWQPLYGAPVSPTSDETSSARSETSGASDSDTTSAPTLDTDAAPTHSGATSESSVPSAELDAGATEDAGADDSGGGDAAAEDGSVDAGADAALPDETSGVIVQPPYGAPFPRADISTVDTGPVPGYGAPSLDD